MNVRPKCWIVVVALAALFLAACTPNQRIVEDSAERSARPVEDGTPVTVEKTFEQDVESMRTADFLFIYVLRRKDGGKLDPDDKRYASQVIPQEMNRREISDSGKAIIVGSNFRMPEQNRKVLSERFAFEDLSSGKMTTPVR